MSVAAKGQDSTSRKVGAINTDDLSTTVGTDLLLLRVRRRGHWARRILPLVFLAVGVVASASFLRNQALDWQTVWSYMFDERVLAGLWMTIRLTVISMAIGLALACVVAGMRMSGLIPLQLIGAIFVWFFRSVPLVVLLIFAFNMGLLYPRVVIDTPLTPPLLDIRTVDLVSATVAAVIGLSLHEAAYGSEVVRSSLMAVPRGQREAGLAIGMTHAKVYRRIVVPQAMRVATPLLTNQLIQMTKNTSIVAFISVVDLLYAVQSIYAVNSQIIPLLLVATVWYVVVVTVLTVLQSFLERRFGAHERHSWARNVGRWSRMRPNEAA